MSHLRAGLTLLLLALNLAFWLVPITALAMLRVILPSPSVSSGLRRMMEWLAVAAIAVSTRIWEGLSGVHVEWSGEPVPEIHQTCIVIANHQSWADILLLQRALAHRTPPLKWLAKRELLMVPIIGMICWAYGYPMLRRYSRSELANNPALRERDRQQVRKACEALQASPGTMIVYPEGTRYSRDKAQRAGDRHTALLPPRSGGVTTLIDMLGGHLAGVLDFTIRYPERPPSLWALLGGRYDSVSLHFEYVSAQELPFLAVHDDARHALIKQWLDERWRNKDHLLSS